MRKTLFLLLTIALLGASVAQAADFKQTLEEHWLRMLSGKPTGILNHRGDEPPKVEPFKREEHAKYVTEKLIQETLELADKTVEYVEAKTSVDGKLKKQIAEMKKQFEEKKVPENQRLDFYLKLRHLRREIIFLHPDLNFEKILINRNPPTKYSHNGDQSLGHHSRIGPGLTILTNWKTVPQVKPMLPKGALPEGATRNPDLHYDANKVIFAYCDHTREGLKKRYFLYEAAIDGSYVKQLTGTKTDPLDTHGNRVTVPIEDNDPCYLPDGGVVFISTRSQSFGRCHGGRFNPAWPLWRMEGDGTKIRQISYNNENEYEPAVLNDGRVVFTRWEYTNRHEMWWHMLWACRPDGTEVTNYYGADTRDPMMIVETSAIPNSHKTVATVMAHHSYNTGTIVVIDPKKGENGTEPITDITPEVPYPEFHGWPMPHFSHPCAINEELFLVSRANHKVPRQGQLPPANDRAIYLIDSLGGREFLYEDPEVASVSPIAVRKRKRPPVLPSRLTPNQDYGTLFVQNAYLTRNDPDGIIKPGMIKAIRVNAIGVQPLSNKVSISSKLRVEIPKKILGTVPVGPDGSAFFKVPAETAIHLQILDENGMAILTEKSFFYLQKGENRSCVGCHEPSGTAPIAEAISKMSRSKPMDLTPPAGPQYVDGNSFHRSVQPVLDRYCIKCHGLEKTEHKISFVGADSPVTPGMAALVERGEHRIGDKGYMGSQGGKADISEPRRHYAYSNKVAQMLLKNPEFSIKEPKSGNLKTIDNKKFVEAHKNLKIDKESRQQIFDWMDLNCQSAGNMFNASTHPESRRLDGGKMKELREYAKSVLGDKFVDAKVPDRALVNPVQPEESRILLAPLSEKDGGWGQVKGYANKNDAKFKKMQELVEAAIVRRPEENTRGWFPTHDTGGAVKNLVEERRKFFASLGRDFDAEKGDKKEEAAEEKK